MSRPDRLRVLLLWPGGLFTGGANFGVPQLLSLAAAIRKESGASVDVVDLDMERAFGRVDLGRLLEPGYDLVGISCYSSYEYLKVMLIAERVRELLPRACLVTGGYHPSARPEDFTREGSAFDYVVVGDGERPLARLVQGLETGKRPPERVLGPEPLGDPRQLVPYDWSLLDRYRPIARRVATQAEIYLSRGCPFDCSFCMERAKRDVSWRALDPEQAVEELHRLDHFLDLSGFTLFVADALFGMKRSWRRAFLEALVRRPIRARKIWLLIRLDLIELEDIELMARANVGPGFGLESGDPGQLARIGKSRDREGFLEKILQVSEWTRAHDVAWGANIIVGHPGETESSLRTSAAFMRRLFLDHPKGTHGFLSVDPFRLYPGSPIAEEREAWEGETGMRAHRYPWWEDGDQDFLSEWVDPSRELGFRRAAALGHELFAPILGGIRERFAYGGPARDYYMRAVSEQIDLSSPRRRLRRLGMWQLWSALLGETSDAERRASVAADAELGAVAVEARRATLEARRITPSPRLRAALERVPRERFVPLDQIPMSAEDRPLVLDEEGRSTISALHAYAVGFDALELGEGDALVDLGGGTGYGAALAADVVGETGSVLSIEIEPTLSALARENLRAWPNARAVTASAHEVELWKGALKIFTAFAVERVPAAWLDALGEGGTLVVPVGTRTSQELTRFRRAGADVLSEPLGRVIYVADRAPRA